MLKLEERRALADRLLVWLKAHNLNRWDSNSAIFHRFTEDTDEQVYNVWKAYDLLRQIGRLGLNCPNGRKGGYVISFTPLSKPDSKQPNIHNIKVDLLKHILKDLKSQFANEWDEALKEL